MATVEERRLKVRDKYRTIIGRNYYSQARRNYCYKKYSNGKYYSDCSSSVSWTYKEVGESFGILNTVGMWTSKKLVDVPVKIVKGQITNPEVLAIGDMLLFAGNDAGRKAYGYVGHVEMVGEISGGKVTLYGHGSGHPKKHNMVSYCKTRYNSKSSTPLKHKGLIRVRRFITGDSPVPPSPGPYLGDRDLKMGDAGPDVMELQEDLSRLGWSFPRFGCDGEFGAETDANVKGFQRAASLPVTGIFDRASYDALMGVLNRFVEVTGKSVNVRSGPGLNYAVLGIVHQGDLLPYGGQRSADGWYLIDYNGMNAWISGKYGRLCNE